MVLLPLHIAAGAVAIVAGFIALYVRKGARSHRGSGIVFVCAMLTMAVAGFTLAILRNKAPDINVPAAVLTFYLVVTGLATVRPFVAWTRAAQVGAAGAALGVGLIMLAFGAEAIANGGRRHGFPAFPYIMFSAVGLIAGVGDLRVLRSGAPRGVPRLARHLWRMCFALFIATLSFFLGQAKVFPKPIRIPGLLALPVLAVLVTMGYWLWRVRRARGLVRARLRPATGQVAATAR